MKIRPRRRVRISSISRSELVHISMRCDAAGCFSQFCPLPHEIYATPTQEESTQYKCGCSIARCDRRCRSSSSSNSSSSGSRLIEDDWRLRQSQAQTVTGTETLAEQSSYPSLSLSLSLSLNYNNATDPSCWIEWRRRRWRLSHNQNRTIHQATHLEQTQACNKQASNR